MVPGVPCVDSGNWVQDLQCFAEIFFSKNQALNFDVTYKDVARFRKGSVHELECLKASQVSKVHA